MARICLCDRVGSRGKLVPNKNCRSSVPKDISIKSEVCRQRIVEHGERREPYWQGFFSREQSFWQLAVTVFKVPASMLARASRRHTRFTKGHLIFELIRPSLLGNVIKYVFTSPTVTGSTPSARSHCLSTESMVVFFERK